MGFMANIKGQKALSLQSKGDDEGAKKLYEEAIGMGMNEPRMLLGYALLLIRGGEFQKAKDLLVKTQKAPGISPEQKVQLFMDYAVCCFKLGDLEKGVQLLERQHIRQPAGLIYETLGYLYVEKYDPENAPKAQEAPAAPEEDGAAEPADEANDEAASDAPAELSGEEKALSFLKEAVDYDEDDPVCLDNLAQFYYRALGDKAQAREWFDKAIAEKPGQIDTLWFLSRYDLEAGDVKAAVERLEKALEGRFSPLNYADKARIEAEIARLRA